VSRRQRQTPSGAASSVRYTESDGLHIAYQVTGQGDLGIVLISGCVSHLELDWADPSQAQPPTLQLDFIGPLYMLALIVPTFRTAAARAAMSVGAAAAVLATLLPLHLEPGAGMVARLLVGSLVMRKAS